jgi:hypothetical protein
MWIIAHEAPSTEGIPEPQSPIIASAETCQNGMYQIEGIEATEAHLCGFGFDLSGLLSKKGFALLKYRSVRFQPMSFP